MNNITNNEKQKNKQDTEIYISKDAKISKGVTFLGKCKIGAGTVVYPNTIIENCEIGANCVIKCGLIENVTTGDNVRIYNNVQFIGKNKIGSNCTIYPNTTIEDCTIGSNCIIKSSFLEKSIINNNVGIGPFAHIRPNSVLDNNCHIGNFVEVKNSFVGAGTKASHLAYVGDADVGSNCNIGCGAIFVNYNGKEKNRTKVGNNCFIGSNCNIVAPVDIADNTYICAGTTVTHNTNEYDFIIGRSRETVKPNKAKNYLKEDKD